jgi:preprotein translocase subunit SecB
MATTNGGPAPGGPGVPGAQPAAGTAQFNVLGQYIKDFSFENPHAPRSLTQSQQQPPTINLQINVNAKPIADDEFEIELKLEGKADAGSMVLFNFELLYAGIFRIQGVPQESLQPLMLIECPRLLFPFAREIVASAVQNGGFPPLRIDPIDFVGLYRQRMAEMGTPVQPPAAG